MQRPLPCCDLRYIADPDPIGQLYGKFAFDEIFCRRLSFLIRPHLFEPCHASGFDASDPAYPCHAVTAAVHSFSAKQMPSFDDARRMSLFHV
jgi:hypothetical protein